ncbi:hypothetical protein [Achromobacter denitrificans]|uniref:hypothetical protein n=1 Tax=Achromobacter denitrificans TaxID=32002 RepID=UPI000F692690|nr:hypothetical protein [Achromobacter denitrificans]RSE88610.1 hypothetical protein EGU64_05155 [Achromobacter denitrificans]
MKIQAFARYGVIALALALAGFIGAIGVLTLIFAPKSGAYAPTTSSDAAAWLQAGGSIVAIFASYWLGERQARKAREQALELFDLQRMRIEDGAHGIVDQLYGEVLSIHQTARELHFIKFKKVWESYLRNASQAALDAFDNMPLHEMGTAKRVRTAFELRAVLQHEVGQIDVITDWSFEIASSPLHGDVLKDARTEGDERIQEIRNLAQGALDRQTTLRDIFDRSYED